MRLKSILKFNFNHLKKPFPLKTTSDSLSFLITQKSRFIFLGALVVLGTALVFQLSTLPVYGQVPPNSWNLQKDASNNLNFYYTGGNDILRLINSSQSVSIPGKLGVGTAGPVSEIEIQKDDVNGEITFHDPGQYWWTLGLHRSSGGYFMINAGGDLINGVLGVTTPAISINPSSYKTGLRALNATAYALFVPGLTGDTSGAGYFGSSASTYNQWALTGESYGGVGVYGNSVGSYGLYGTSTNATGVGGVSTNNIGVLGQSTSNNGVQGNTTSGIGVAGYSTSNHGVYGNSTSSHATVGVSGSGIGVYGISNTSIGVHGVSNSTNNWAGTFISTGSPYGVYARADGGTPGWTMQADRVTDNSLAGGGELLTHNYGPENDTSGYLILTISDANNNQGPAGADIEFYVRGDGYVASDNGMVGSGADVAEWTPTKYAKDLEPGDLLMVDGSSSESLTKKSDGTPYSSKLMGIISTNPGIISGGIEAEAEHGKNDVLVALAGRVPTKVSTENGIINPGDFLTSSSTPGVAMKATKSGMVVGKALENFNGKGTGKILVWVEPLWYGGEELKQSEIDTLKKELEQLKEKLK